MRHYNPVFLCMGFKNKLYIYAENTPIRELLEKIAERANFKFTNFHNFHPFGVHGMVSPYFLDEIRASKLNFGTFFIR